MNWLAHICLSENNIEYQLGNLLADPLKGKSRPGASPQLKAGLKMHAHIDAFTDTHPQVLISKSRLGPRGFHRGEDIDITYDYFLSVHWPRYAKRSLADFIDQFHLEAAIAASDYPKEVKYFIDRVIHSQLLSSHQTLSGLEAALSRIDRRLSARVLARESAAGYFPAVQAALPELEKDFLIFFPELIAFFKSKAMITSQTHWLRETRPLIK